MIRTAALFASVEAVSITKCEWSGGALSVSWANSKEDPSDYYEVQVAQEVSGDVFAVYSTGKTEAALDFLSESRSYWVKVRSHVAASPSLGPGTWRDAGPEVECKTGSGALLRAQLQSGADTMVLEVLRQSEYTYDVDYLMNHNSGDLGGDTSFVVSSSADPDQPGFLNTTFRQSVFTLYCLEVLKANVPDTVTTDGDDRFADYLSCNDNHNATDPQCQCDNWIDRSLSKADNQTKYCHQADGSQCSSKNRHDCTCECTDSSLAYSAKYVGMMPVYYNQPELLGYWFSTPKDAECAENESVGQKRADGSVCTWKRGKEARVVRGGDALGYGWNASAGHGFGKLDAALVRQNAAVFRDLFDSQSFQRWSCDSFESVISV